jgi:hypothetical protein
MKESLENYDFPIEQRHVDVINILKNGEILKSKRELEPHEHKFNWLDSNEVVRLVLSLRAKTLTNKKSVVAVYESGEIKIFENKPKDFLPPLGI